MSTEKIALVTGASRGAGAGIARGLGEEGMTVYITGRSDTRSEARGWDGTPLPGTLRETAEAIQKAGGKAIPVVCDHADDEQVAALFERIAKDSGHLDILVNNATYMHPELIEQKPFWEKGVDACGILDVGLRSAYVASWHAARMMVPRGSGTIAFGSSFGASCYMHGPAYGAQKAGLDKFAQDMAVDLRDSGVRIFSIWMGPLRTERAEIARTVNPEQYEAFSKVAEYPEFTGHIVHELSRQALGAELTGQTLIAAEVARQLGIQDRGEDRPSYRDSLGSPRELNPAIVY